MGAVAMGAPTQVLTATGIITTETAGIITTEAIATTGGASATSTDASAAKMLRSPAARS